MDPRECLVCAAKAIGEGDQITADDLMDCYVNWRGIGGFNPRIGDPVRDDLSIDGDTYFRQLIRRYEKSKGFGKYLGAQLP